MLPSDFMLLSRHRLSSPDLWMTGRLPAFARQFLGDILQAGRHRLRLGAEWAARVTGKRALATEGGLTLPFSVPHD